MANDNVEICLTLRMVLDHCNCPTILQYLYFVGLCYVPTDL